MKKLVIGSIVILSLAAVPVMAFAVPAQAHHGYDHTNHNHGYCQGILPDINQGTQSALTTYATAAANATAQIEAKQAAEAAAAAAEAASQEAAAQKAAAQKATARQAVPQNANPQSNTYSARHYFVDNNGDGICDNYGSANCGHSGGGTNGGGRHHSEGGRHH